MIIQAIVFIVCIFILNLTFVCIMYFYIIFNCICCVCFYTRPNWYVFGEHDFESKLEGGSSIKIKMYT